MSRKQAWKYYLNEYVSYYESYETKEVIKGIKQELKALADRVAEERNMEIIKTEYKIVKSEIDGYKDLWIMARMKDRDSGEVGAE